MIKNLRSLTANIIDFIFIINIFIFHQYYFNFVKHIEIDFDEAINQKDIS